MDEKEYDKKYGVDSSDEKVKSFHASRRMFAIYEGQLILAKGDVTYSHAKWFELEGWMNPQDDSLMEEITRGYLDESGVYFYKGYDFIIDEQSEKEMLEHVGELVKKTNLNTKLHLFGGKIKQEKEGDWPPRKDYGELSNLID